MVAEAFVVAQIVNQHNDFGVAIRARLHVSLSDRIVYSP